MKWSEAFKRVSCLAVLVAGALVGVNAHAQPYPSRPITFIYPFPQGSGPEIVMRQLAGHVGNALGQNIVVEIRTGSAGRNSLKAMATGPKDGYLIGFASASELITQALADPALEAEPRVHFAPVIVAFKNFQVLYANASAPFKDGRSMLAYAKANPGKLNWGTSPGIAGHLTLELLKAATGLDIVYVPFRGGPPAITALLGGEIDLVSTDSAPKPLVDAGKLIALGTTNSQRRKPFPDLPTLQEQGLNGFEVTTWHSVIAPPGTSPEAIAKLRQAYGNALKLPDVVRKLEELGAEPADLGPDEFVSLVQADLKKWGPIVRKLGLKFN